MAFPPPTLPVNRTDSLYQQTNHPADHNAVNGAVNDIVTEILTRSVASRTAALSGSIASTGVAKDTSLSTILVVPASNRPQIVLGHVRCRYGISAAPGGGLITVWLKGNGVQVAGAAWTWAAPVGDTSIQFGYVWNLAASTAGNLEVIMSTTPNMAVGINSSPVWSVLEAVSVAVNP